jgi:putative transposase
VQNCFIESFNGRLGDECLSRHWFFNLTNVGQIVEEWRLNYILVRPTAPLAG